MSINQTFKALSDQTRREVLELLKKKDMSVTEISQSFDISLPSLSHHLSTLKQVNLVSSRRRGQEMIYSLNLSVFEEVSKMIIKLFKQ
ncbi:MAG: autorepressor SdpR family transcription factor [Patescibacteria group bacterium]|jgi:ArsR family transcriptional regulator|nr:autorepressor SdpR family transcription factor [Patescibacteria group bacterium]